MEDKRCACVSQDAYTCFSVRYNMPHFAGRQAVEHMGGPCECCCHDNDVDYDDVDNYSLDTCDVPY